MRWHFSNSQRFQWPALGQSNPQIGRDRVIKSESQPTEKKLSATPGLPLIGTTLLMFAWYGFGYMRYYNPFADSIRSGSALWPDPLVGRDSIALSYPASFAVLEDCYPFIQRLPPRVLTFQLENFRSGAQGLMLRRGSVKPSISSILVLLPCGCFSLVCISSFPFFLRSF